MARIKKEDIIGYELSEETVCVDCLEVAEEENLKLDQIITRNEFDDEVFIFCDRCRDRIQ